MAGTASVTAHNFIEVACERLNKDHHILIGSQAMFNTTLNHKNFCERSEVRMGGKLAYPLEL